MDDSPVMFAQVREDPSIEINLLNKLNKSDPRILLICSGGDTILSLFSNSIAYDMTIDAVDINLNQIMYTKLKIALYKYLDLDEFQILITYGAPYVAATSGAPCVAVPGGTIPGVVATSGAPCVAVPGGTIPCVAVPGGTIPCVAVPGGTIPGVTVDSGTILNPNELLKQLTLDKETYEFWSQSDKIKWLQYGINQAGRYEMLFEDLIDSNYDFDALFNNNNLIKLFGYNAVTNSSGNFAKHFENVIKTYHQKYSKPTDNYFWYQILNNSYPHQIGPVETIDLPYFLKSKVYPNVSNIHYHHQSLEEYLDSLESCDSANDDANKLYDIIHTSNITDWMDQNHISILIQKIYSRLNPSGYIVMRRLLGAQHLEPLLIQNNFKITNVTHEEKSHFYNEVIIGCKSSAIEGS